METFETLSRVATRVRMASVSPITARSAGTKLGECKLKWYTLASENIPSNMCHIHDQSNLFCHQLARSYS